MKITSCSKKYLMAAAVLLGVLPVANNANADIKQIKMYKEAYDGAKPKCIDCHAVEKPKKEDGQHDLNAYGQAIKAKAAEPTVDTYKEVGPVEKFGK